MIGTPSNIGSLPYTHGAHTGWEWLPAWRWNGHMPALNVNLGAASPQNMSDILLHPIMELCFSIAGFLWAITLWITRQALSFSLSASVGSTLDSIFSGMTNSILGSAVLGAVIVFVAFSLIRNATKGQNPVKTAISSLIPLAILGMMAYSSAGSPGSPSWLLSQTQNLTGLAAGQVASVVTPTAVLPSGGTSPSCPQYQAALHQAFTASHKSLGISATDATIASAVSSLWESSYEANWTQAQFGLSPDGTRIACHVLENGAGVSPVHQADVGLFITQLPAGSSNLYPTAAAAWQNQPDLQNYYYPGGTATGVTAGSATCNNTASISHLGTSCGQGATGQSLAFGGPYGPFPSETFLTHGVFAWAMCSINGNGQWMAAPDFASLNVSGQTWSKVAPGACSLWWNQGSGIYSDHMSPSSGPTGNLNPFAQNTGSDIYAATTTKSGAINGIARSFMRTWNGHNATTGAEAALISLLTAILFLITFGGLAAGAVLAQVGLVVFLAISPILLLVAAIPGKGSRATALSNVYLSAAFFKVIFLLAASLLATLSAFVAELLANSSGSMMATFVPVAAPLIAYILLKMLAKKLGMATGIFSFKGAMGTALATMGGAEMGALLGADAMRHLRRGHHGLRRTMSRGARLTGLGRRRGGTPNTPNGAQRGRGAANQSGTATASANNGGPTGMGASPAEALPGSEAAAGGDVAAGAATAGGEAAAAAGAAPAPGRIGRMLDAIGSAHSTVAKGAGAAWRHKGAIAAGAAIATTGLVTAGPILATGAAVMAARSAYNRRRARVLDATTAQSEQNAARAAARARQQTTQLSSGAPPTPDAPPRPPSRTVVVSTRMPRADADELRRLGVNPADAARHGATQALANARGQNDVVYNGRRYTPRPSGLLMPQQ